MNNNQRTADHAPSGSLPENEEGGAAAGCCGGPAPAHSTACCARDADVKSGGGAGCGCAGDARPAAAFNRILLLMRAAAPLQACCRVSSGPGSKMRAGNAETARVARCADR